MSTEIHQTLLIIVSKTWMRVVETSKILSFILVFTVDNVLDIKCQCLNKLKLREMTQSMNVSSKKFMMIFLPGN